MPARRKIDSHTDAKSGSIHRRLRTALAAGALALVPLSGSEALAQELNALIWCDHADPALLNPFEEANGVKVNIKEFEGTGAGLAIVEQSQPGDWDVMVIDFIDVPRGVEKGLFAPLPEDQLPFADLFAEVTMDGSTKVDGSALRQSRKSSATTRSASTTPRSIPPTCRSMASLTGEKYKGRIAIYDYYLPVIGMAALAAGKKTSELTRSRSAGDQGGAPQDEGEREAGRRGRGEPDGARDRRGRHPGRRRRVGDGGPRQGEPGARLLDPVGRRRSSGRSRSPCSSDVKNKELALKFIQYVMSPEGQARLATSSCYWGMPASKKAALSEDEKKTLRFDEQDGFLARAQPYPAPDADLDKKFQDLWTEMLQAN